MDVGVLVSAVIELDVTPLIFRWLHIGAVIVLVGGLVCWRLVVLPGLDGLNEADRRSLDALMAGRWKLIVHATIVLILASGVYNLMAKVRSTTPVWHGILGVKLLLALAIFFLAEALVGRSRGLEPLRQRPRGWLSLAVGLAAAVVLLSATMRALPLKQPPPPPPVAASS